MSLKRGDIYWVNLDPTVGSEVEKGRPCDLVGAIPINGAGGAVLVLPLSSSGTPHPPLSIQVECLGRRVVAICDQLRAIDKSRLQEKAGSLGAGDLKKIEDGLRQTLSL